MTWLSSNPPKNHGMYLSLKEFNDAIHIRYDLKLHDISAVCESGENKSVDHAMICKLGGFTTLRHNIVRDISAQISTINMLRNQNKLLCCHFYAVKNMKQK